MSDIQDEPRYTASEWAKLRMGMSQELGLAGDRRTEGQRNNSVDRLLSAGIIDVRVVMFRLEARLKARETDSPS